MPKAKVEAPLYDANGRWVEERGRVKGAIRRTFRLSPQMKEALARARVELPPKTLKDGSIGKKNQIRYRCACCDDLFPQKYVQVDHIKPVVPLWIPESDMSYDEIVRGVFCALDNLQVICSTPMKKNNNMSSCHKLKTDEENFIRDELKKIPGVKDLPEDQINGMILDIQTQYKAYVEKRDREKREKLARKQERQRKLAERLGHT